MPKRLFLTLCLTEITPLVAKYLSLSSKSTLPTFPASETGNTFPVRNSNKNQIRLTSGPVGLTLRMMRFPSPAKQEIFASKQVNRLLHAASQRTSVLVRCPQLHTCCRISRHSPDSFVLSLIRLDEMQAGLRTGASTLRHCTNADNPASVASVGISFSWKNEGCLASVSQWKRLLMGGNIFIISKIGGKNFFGAENTSLNALWWNLYLKRAEMTSLGWKRLHFR